MEAAPLAVVGVGVTVAVYGSVALIVKMDDVGLYMAQNSDTGLGQGIGRGLVKGMPLLMKFLSVVGTAAMLWVGGSIMIHGLHDLGVHHPYQDIHHLAEIAAHAVPDQIAGFAKWATTAFCDGVLGLLYGFLLIPIATRIVTPLINTVTGAKSH
jgi:predicted DNA repair protein MutK